MSKLKSIASDHNNKYFKNLIDVINRLTLQSVWYIYVPGISDQP